MKKKTPAVGDICESTQGRDEGTFYVVIEVTDEKTVLVADGRLKKVANPKRKNLKHVRLLPDNSEELACDISSGKARDEKIRKTLEKYGKKTD